MLMEDSSLRTLSEHSWKAILPRVLKQIELETAQNRRLHKAIANTDLSDKGMV